MGNLALCMLGDSKPKPKYKKMVQVMKVNDGKILEFGMSIEVKHLLMNYPNYYVGLFKDATQPLPLEYKLKTGHIYYLFPYNVDIANAKDTSSEIPKPKDGATRIKLVITRQQLHRLLSNQVRVETILLDIDDKQCKNPIDLSQSRLQSISE